MQANLMEDDDLRDDGRKFWWIDYMGCVRQIAVEMADNGGKYDLALRSIRLSQYALRVGKMTGKHRQQLKRDAQAEAKHILRMREAADIGDIVLVPKLVPNPLLGGAVRDGRALVEAEIVGKYLVSRAYRYTVRRIADGCEQRGTSHMIKSVIRKRRVDHGN